ncbi:MAG: hypothetical protein LUE27_06805 [Clostridia bacterium]|nr:hypothetical protein [Clostridia bacterium]
MIVFEDGIEVVYASNGLPGTDDKSTTEEEYIWIKGITDESLRKRLNPKALEWYRPNIVEAIKALEEVREYDGYLQ